ncbi:hypothetical protein BV898_06207 [Hypsibius exemplaris]|uniref:Neurensin-1 n=1 Tax=Hypsibius exemplaris TaxID=2072580 RepID=A0A1W0WWU6_HYPEX|nr:hypothetical protein BV898_06207 [Hypsibius exemplaris]
MSDSEEDDEPRCREKVKKTLLSFSDRQASKSKLDYKGVKSYLHQFYEYAKDPEVSGKDGEFLVKSRRVRVRSIYWRGILAIGLLLMGLGLCAVLVSYLLPQRSVIVEADEELAVVDKDADHFNQNVEYLKLTGLAVFCVGGVSSSMALMLASCCFRRCNALESSSKGSRTAGFEDLEPVKVAKKLVEEGGDVYENDGLTCPPMSPSERKVPGQESVFGVQPAEKGATENIPYPLPVINTSSTIL